MRNAVGKQAGECFHRFFKFSQTFMSISITTLCQQLVLHVVLCFYQVIETQFKPISAFICFEYKMHVYELVIQ